MKVATTFLGQQTDIPMALLAKGFKEALQEITPSHEEDKRCVLFGAHRKPESIRDFEDWPNSPIIYNTESLDYSRRLHEVKPAFKSYEIWDYSLRNTERWKSEGFNAKYVPFGKWPSLDYHPTQANYPDYDVIFIGALSDYRCSWFFQCGCRGRWISGVWGEDLKPFYEQTFASLNIPIEEHNQIHASLRTIESLVNRTPVLTLPTKDTPSWILSNPNVYWFRDSSELQCYEETLPYEEAHFVPDWSFYINNAIQEEDNAYYE